MVVSDAASVALCVGTLQYAREVEKREILEHASFGERIAEEEMAELSSYFVVTDQWRQLVAGEKDIVYGAKGSGKSALYSLLVQKADELFDRSILIVPAENPSGVPVFRQVAQEPPLSETEFITLWKLYLATLAAAVLREYEVMTAEAKQVYRQLEQSGLLLPRTSLGKILRAVRQHARRVSEAKAVEGGIAWDPATGMPTGITGKVHLADPPAWGADLGSVDDLLADADQALAQLGFKVWIVIDRLDVAFVQHENVEQDALRALFKTYRDIQGLDNLSLKIFLRTDIWKKISAKGFREASHITRHLTITWEPQALLQLVMRRTLKNEEIASYYAVEPQTVFASVDEQQKLLQRMFPDQVDPGRNLNTFEWMLSRTQDGSKQPAPRELIHLLASLRTSQIRRLEVGNEPPADELLFERQAFKDALAEVSEVRLSQTLYAEYPELKEYVEQLEGEKTQQTPQTLAHVWRLPIDEAVSVARQLVDRGFFELRGTKEEPVYWVPFLYRSALGMSQGEARGFLAYGRALVDRTVEILLQRIADEQQPEPGRIDIGDGYESSSILFRDARTRESLELAVFAAETKTQLNFGERAALVGVGIRLATGRELDRDAYRIRLSGAFRWMTHRNAREGYRLTFEVADFRSRSVDDAARVMADRVIHGLERASMLPRVD